MDFLNRNSILTEPPNARLYETGTQSVTQATIISGAGVLGVGADSGMVSLVGRPAV